MQKSSSKGFWQKQLQLFWLLGCLRQCITFGANHRVAKKLKGEAGKLAVHRSFEKLWHIPETPGHAHVLRACLRLWVSSRETQDGPKHPPPTDPKVFSQAKSEGCWQSFQLLGWLLKACPNMHMEPLMKDWEICWFQAVKVIFVWSLAHH